MLLLFSLFENKKEEPACKDAELIQRAKGGDNDAFCEIVKKYENYCYRLAFCALKNTDDAWDVCQETFIRVYRSLQSFRCDCELSTWLYRVCHNAIYDFIRKSKKNAPLSVSDISSDDEQDFELADTDESNNPENALMKKERIRMVRLAISELSHEHKQILLLRDIEGFGYDEIAEILHLEIGTVKSRISRARAALKKVLIEKGILN